jgi:iron complex transport system ATP-binding protein
MRGVSVCRVDHETAIPTDILRSVTWTVRPGERWVVMGPNGAGKSTLLDMAAAMSHPTGGSAWVIGEQLGTVPLVALRRRIGHVPAAIPETWLETGMTAVEVVRTGWLATIATIEGSLERPPGARVDEVLELMGVARLADRPFRILSRGERQRVQIARALIHRPALLVLDEPAVGLDLAGREVLARTLDEVGAYDPDLATVMVTHHLEEIPSSATHALLLAGGSVVANGPISGVLTSELLEQAFGVRLHVWHTEGRWSATS